MDFRNRRQSRNIEDRRGQGMRIGGKGKVNTLLACRPTRVRVLSDILMIGTENDGLYIYDIKSLQQAGHYAFNGFHRRVSDFALDRDGNLWVTGDAGVWTWNGSSWARAVFPPKVKVPDGMASRIVIDSKNRIFVAFATNAMVHEQVCLYNGSFLERTDPATVQRLLQAGPETGDDDFIDHGCILGGVLRDGF